MSLTKETASSTWYHQYSSSNVSEILQGKICKYLPQGLAQASRKSPSCRLCFEKENFIFTIATHDPTRLGTQISTSKCNRGAQIYIIHPIHEAWQSHEMIRFVSRNA